MSFKSSTRLECMMQDYPKTLPPTARIGFTVTDPWLAYAPVKNNPEDAAKVPKGNPYHSATSGKMAIYRANSLMLKKAGVTVGDPLLQVFNGQEVEVLLRVTWKVKLVETVPFPRNILWSLTVVSGNCSISQKNNLVINSPNIFLEILSVDGALVINSVEDSEVIVGGLVQNKGWNLENIDYKYTSAPEEVRIRGFRVNRVEQLEKTYNETGKFCLKA